MLVFLSQISFQRHRRIFSNQCICVYSGLMSCLRVPVGQILMIRLKWKKDLNSRELLMLAHTLASTQRGKYTPVDVLTRTGLVIPQNNPWFCKQWWVKSLLQVVNWLDMPTTADYYSNCTRIHAPCSSMGRNPKLERARHAQLRLLSYDWTIAAQGRSLANGWFPL